MRDAGTREARQSAVLALGRDFSSGRPPWYGAYGVEALRALSGDSPGRQRAARTVAPCVFLLLDKGSGRPKCVNRSEAGRGSSLVPLLRQRASETWVQARTMRRMTRPQASAKCASFKKSAKTLRAGSSPARAF